MGNRRCDVVDIDTDLDLQLEVYQRDDGLTMLTNLTLPFESTLISSNIVTIAIHQTILANALLTIASQLDAHLRRFPGARSSSYRREAHRKFLLLPLYHDHLLPISLTSIPFVLLVWDCRACRSPKFNTRSKLVTHSPLAMATLS